MIDAVVFTAGIALIASRWAISSTPSCRRRRRRRAVLAVEGHRAFAVRGAAGGGAADAGGVLGARERMLAAFGPLLVIVLLASWVALQITGFACVWWALHDIPTVGGFGDAVLLLGRRVLHGRVRRDRPDRRGAPDRSDRRGVLRGDHRRPRDRLPADPLRRVLRARASAADPRRRRDRACDPDSARQGMGPGRRPEEGRRRVREVGAVGRRDPRDARLRPAARAVPLARPSPELGDRSRSAVRRGGARPDHQRRDRRQRLLVPDGAPRRSSERSPRVTTSRATSRRSTPIGGWSCSTTSTPISPRTGSTCGRTTRPSSTPARRV